MRADARRNRELLVAAAHDVFSAQGAGASMEAIAKEAGVGVGTLYRHFPNRLDLVEAVYQTDVEELWETAQRVVAELEPWPAVEAFFEAFLRYARDEAGPHGRAAPGLREEPGHAVTGARRCIESSFDLVIDRAKAAGAVRRRCHRLRRHAAGEPRSAPMRASSRSRPSRLLRMVLDGMRADAGADRSRLTGTTLPGSNCHCCRKSEPRRS